MPATSYSLTTWIHEKVGLIETQKWNREAFKKWKKETEELEKKETEAFKKKLILRRKPGQKT